ncbi:MAG: alkaline phosphatase family protein [Acidobacteria bacterium]|nr:MAG: alkaline phosphatase family protein [Acidobacteriota bacterium]
MLVKTLVVIGLLICASSAVAQSASPVSASVPAPPRNLILFVADGLRHNSVNPDAAPTMFSLRQRGVDFVNSHSLYPTFTTPNASALATGHGLGDTGDFGNTLYTGHAIGRDAATATLTPFIENNLFLARLNDYYNGNYLGQPTIMDLARANGYAVAVVGKLGPTAIQDIAEIRAPLNDLQPTSATIIDDTTGPQGIPLPQNVREEMNASGLPASAPDRSNGHEPSSRHNNGRPGTLAANFYQQQYLASAATQAVLPALRKQLKPFFLIFWSRDPDGTQHNQGDSIDQLYPGINGPTSRAAIRNADNDLWQIVDYLKANDLDRNTDIIVVADHGFSTISKREISRTGTPTKSFAASKTYLDVKEGYLPSGFLAIDLAHALKKPLYDPDAPSFATEDGNYYQRISPCDCDDSKFLQHPSFGNGVIGGSGRVPGPAETTDAEVIVAANGGSDLIYLPQESAPKNTEANKQLAQSISSFLVQQDYADGIFVRDDLGDFPGTLPLSAIGLIGSTKLPKPAIVVNFKSFPLAQDPLLTRVEIADSSLQEGGGMHGSFSRADTFNAMLAFGPDFKPGFADRVPASNADIAVTIAAILKLKFPEGNGTLRGRVLSEALKDGPDTLPFTQPPPKISSQAAPNGMKTVLHYQVLDEHTYYDQACLVNTTDNKEAACK